MNIKLDNHTVRTNKERRFTGRPMEAVTHAHAPFSHRKDGRGGVKNIRVNFLIQLGRLVRRLLESNSLAICRIESGRQRTKEARTLYHSKPDKPDHSI